MPCLVYKTSGKFVAIRTYTKMWIVLCTGGRGLPSDMRLPINGFDCTWGSTDQQTCFSPSSTGHSLMLRPPIGLQKLQFWPNLVASALKTLCNTYAPEDWSQRPRNMRISRLACRQTQECQTTRGLYRLRWVVSHYSLGLEESVPNGQRSNEGGYVWRYQTGAYISL